MCVSPCRWCASVSVAHPAATPSAVFRAIRSLLTFVSDASGDHMVETHSSMCLAMALHIAIIVSLRFPHVVDVSVLSIRIVSRASAVVLSMCLLHVIRGSRVSLSILGPMFTGSVMLSICSSSCVLHSAGPGAKRVHAISPGLRLYVRVDAYIPCRHDWMSALAMPMPSCVDAILMPSA